MRMPKRNRFATLGRGAVCLAVLGMALAGCNTGSISQGLQTRNSASEPPREEELRPTEGLGSDSTETALAAETTTSPGTQAALNSGSEPARTQLPRIAFLPVTGAPRSKVATLASAMRGAAESASVPVVVSIEDGASYQVKGYFSALKDSDGTLLVYVWDVLDRNGTRIHRISGQERANAVEGDPWAGVSNDMIDRVAGTTMSSLRSWMQTRS